MSQLQTRPMTAAEFLAWEERQERRWEFDGFQPVAMVGVTWAHSVIQGNLLLALGNRLRGKPCRPAGPEMKVPIPSMKYRYPDAFVTCTPPGPKDRLAPEPVVVFEILSESTSRTDRLEKPREYLSIPTVRRYVILEQDEAALTVITPSETGWSLAVLRGEDTLALPEIGIEVPVAEFYADVAFEPAVEAED